MGEGSFGVIDRDSFVANPEIQQLVAVLTEKADVGPDNNRQSARELVVCPVTVQFQYELTRHRAFSRDISTGGICLIGERFVPVEQIATLTIYRLDDLTTKIRGRCMWSKEFAGDYYLSGWKFLRTVLQHER